MPTLYTWLDCSGSCPLLGIEPRATIETRDGPRLTGSVSYTGFGRFYLWAEGPDGGPTIDLQNVAYIDFERPKRKVGFDVQTTASTVLPTITR